MLVIAGRGKYPFHCTKNLNVHCYGDEPATISIFQRKNGHSHGRRRTSNLGGGKLSVNLLPDFPIVLSEIFPRVKRISAQLGGLQPPAPASYAYGHSLAQTAVAHSLHSKLKLSHSKLKFPRGKLKLSHGILNFSHGKFTFIQEKSSLLP